MGLSFSQPSLQHVARASLLCAIAALSAMVAATASADAEQEAAEQPEPQVVERLGVELASQQSGPSRPSEQRGLAERLWQPREALSAAELEKLPAYCSGTYLERSYPLPVGTDSSLQPTELLADRMTFQRDADGVFTGAVTVTQGNRLLKTDEATVDDRSRDVALRGGVEFSEPGVAVQAARGDMNLNTRSGGFEDVEFVLLQSHMRGVAQTLSQNEAGDLSVGEASFTRCAPGSQGWALSAEALDIEDGAVFGIARSAMLKVGPVPVFYAPFMRFPVSDERVSGWLFPNLRYNSEDGIDVGVPFYWNIAPNADATLTPRFISNRGNGLEVEGRYLNGWSESILGGGFLASDDLYNGVFSKEDFDDFGETGPFDPADRWLYALEHQGQLGNFRTAVDYTAVSDRDYFRDLGTDLAVTSTNELERRGELEYATDQLSMRLWAQRFQRLDEITTEAYQRLPQFDLSFTQPLGPVELALGAQWVSFDRPNDNLAGAAAIVGERTHIEPRLRLPLSWPFGFFTATAGYRQTEYDLSDTPVGVDDAPDRGVGLASIDGGLFFERELNWFGTDLIQTLEPRVYYLYQEFEEQGALPRFDATQLTFGYDQLFRDNRFSGLDRIGDANQLSTGVTTRFLDAENGKERFRASLGQIRYFEDREVTLSGAFDDDDRHASSALASTLSASFGQFNITGDLIWDPYDNEVDESRFQFSWRKDARRILNLGYRKVRISSIEQLEASAYWPVHDRFSVIARFHYDTVFNRTIETFAGLEYNDCCWQVRLFYQRDIQNTAVRVAEEARDSEGIFLQIVFKGLAGLGGRVDSAMERGIRGYSAGTNNRFY